MEEIPEGDWYCPQCLPIICEQYNPSLVLESDITLSSQSDDNSSINVVDYDSNSEIELRPARNRNRIQNGHRSAVVMIESSSESNEECEEHDGNSSSDEDHTFPKRRRALRITISSSTEESESDTASTSEIDVVSIGDSRSVRKHKKAHSKVINHPDLQTGYGDESDCDSAQPIRKGQKRHVTSQRVESDSDSNENSNSREPSLQSTSGVCGEMSGLMWKNITVPLTRLKWKIPRKRSTASSSTQQGTNYRVKPDPDHVDYISVDNGEGGHTSMGGVCVKKEPEHERRSGNEDDVSICSGYITLDDVTTTSPNSVQQPSDGGPFECTMTPIVGTQTIVKEEPEDDIIVIDVEDKEDDTNSLASPKTPRGHHQLVPETNNSHELPQPPSNDRARSQKKRKTRRSKRMKNALMRESTEFCKTSSPWLNLRDFGSSCPRTVSRNKTSMSTAQPQPQQHQQPSVTNWNNYGRLPSSHGSPRAPQPLMSMATASGANRARPCLGSPQLQVQPLFPVSRPLLPTPATDSGHIVPLSGPSQPLMTRSSESSGFADHAHFGVPTVVTYHGPSSSSSSRLKRKRKRRKKSKKVVLTVARKTPQKSEGPVSKELLRKRACRRRRKQRKRAEWRLRRENLKKMELLLLSPENTSDPTYSPSKWNPSVVKSESRMTRARTAATNTPRRQAMREAVMESYRHDNREEGLRFAREILAKQGRIASGTSWAPNHYTDTGNYGGGTCLTTPSTSGIVQSTPQSGYVQDEHQPARRGTGRFGRPMMCVPETPPSTMSSHYGFQTTTPMSRSDTAGPSREREQEYCLRIMDELKRRTVPSRRTLSSVLVTPVQQRDIVLIKPEVQEEQRPRTCRADSSDLIRQLCQNLDDLQNKNNVIQRDGSIVPISKSCVTVSLRACCLWANFSPSPSIVS